MNDFNESEKLNEINISSLPETSIIPIRDLAEFSTNLHAVTRYFLYSIQNGTQMFKQLNATLRLFQDVDFTDPDNIDDPKWIEINEGLINTSILLNATQYSLSNMSDIVDFQSELEYEVLNEFLGELTTFIDNTSDQFNVVDQYFSALDGTYQAVSHFSAGVKSLNQTITQDLTPPNATAVGNYSEAIANFSLSQDYSNTTDLTLSSITSHLLNETTIIEWRSLLVGENNSVYVNADRCLTLINTMGTAGYILLTDLTEFDFILAQADELEWNIFSL